MNSDHSIFAERADYEWLTGGEAASIAEKMALSERPLHILVASLRRQLSAERSRLLLELVELRRRGGDKFTHANRMFFTRTSLEQATDQWVACYKAQRFGGPLAESRELLGMSSPTQPIADLCCGIGGDLIAMAEQGAVTGVDLNPCLTHLAAENARGVLSPELRGRVVVHAMNVHEIDLANFAAWHIDPDRRPQKNGRTTSLEWSSPDLDTIERLLRQGPNAAIKLAPAADVPRNWIENCELEWISRDRQCRQLVVWHGALAQTPGQGRATILAGRGGAVVAGQRNKYSDADVRSITGIRNQSVAIVERLDRYIFDVDPAVSAARLTGVLAVEHNLRALSPGPTYLTGPAIIDDCALACFEVQDVLTFQTKQLSRYFRSRDIGRLEIKKRGRDIAVDPQRLRLALKLRGDNVATLLVTRIAGRHTAIVARRVQHSS